MDGALAALVVAALLVVAAASWAVGSLNGLAGLRELVAEAWRQVDEELTRRHELIPRLAQSLRGRAPHAVAPHAVAVDALLVARAQAVRAASVPGSAGGTGDAAHRDLQRRAAAEEELSRVLAEVLGVAREHPALASDPDVTALALELRGAQDRIAAARRHYNDAVRVLDARLRAPGSRLLARALGISPAVAFVPAPPPGVDDDRAPDPPTPQVRH